MKINLGWLRRLFTRRPKPTYTPDTLLSSTTAPYSPYRSRQWEDLGLAQRVEDTRRAQWEAERSLPPYGHNLAAHHSPDRQDWANRSVQPTFVPALAPQVRQSEQEPPEPVPCVTPRELADTITPTAASTDSGGYGGGCD